MQQNNALLEEQTPMFSVAVWREDKVLFLTLHGELEMDSVNILQNAITEGLMDGVCTEIIADMTDVPFVDSTGYGTFLNGMQTLRQRGTGRVHLVGCIPSVVRVLNVVRLNRIFALYDTLTDARNAVGLTVPV